MPMRKFRAVHQPVSRLRSITRGVLSSRRRSRPERPATRIRDIEVERLAEGRVGTRFHLPESSQSRRNEEAFELMRREELELVGDQRSRAYEGHLSAQHVDQLRKFVKARLPQPAADRE